MIKCGITGHKGVLGSFLKKKLKYRFIKFNGDITKKKMSTSGYIKMILIM